MKAKMNKFIIKIFGIMTFLFEVTVLFFLTTPRFWPTTIFTAIRLSSFLIVTTVVGIGLLLARKWAALIFSFFTGGIGVWFIIGSILSVSDVSGLIINIGFGSLMLVPAYVTFRVWSELSSNKMLVI